MRRRPVDNESWDATYRCPRTGAEWTESFPQSEQHGGGPPLLVRHRPARPTERLVMSKAIHDGDRRPIYLYRSPPQQPDDSGWTATLGELHDLTSPELVAAHISHLLARWPELASVFADSRPESHWEWDALAGQYREILDPGET